MNSLEEVLLAGGYGRAAALLHAAFLESALRLLAEAHVSLVSLASWEEFSVKDGAFGTARRRGPHAGRRLPDEVAVSQELWRRMRHIYGSDPEAWPVLVSHLTQFDHDQPVLIGRRRGKKVRRADIAIVAAASGGPGIVIEAKVVEEERHIRTRLLGPEGLGRFLDGDAYAVDCEFGGLAAYVAAADPPDWSTKIREAYDGLGGLMGPQHVVGLTPPRIDLSVAPMGRPRMGRPDILMVNVVLRFGTLPATAGPAPVGTTCLGSDESPGPTL